MYQYEAKMIKVVDGDTMDFEVDLGFKIKHVIRVRLKNIDTPEMYRPRNAAEKKHGREAAAHVTRHFLGETGRLTTHKDKKGKYGRYLAEFTIRKDGLYCLLSHSLETHGFKKRENY